MNQLLYMEIDLRKLKSNIENIRLIANKEVIPVIKSKAYSLGDIEISKYLQEINIKYVAVVDLIEAIRLVENGFLNNILILNSIDKSDFEYLNKYNNLVVTINELDDIIYLNSFDLNRKVKIHISIDTGMNRTGFRIYQDYQKALEIIIQNGNFQLEGISTHFTNPTNRDNQERRFLEYINDYPYEMVHVAATNTYRHSQIGNYVRIGHDIYGSGMNPNIQQIIKIACKPLVIHHIKKGETIGYDQGFLAKEDMLVAVLPIGYFNGFIRNLKGFPVLVNEKLYPTIGIVCMNHIYVHVDSDVTLDSEFIITNQELNISQMAKYLNTIPHEVLCMINIDNKRYLK